VRRHSVLQLMIVGALILLAFFPSAAAAGAYEVSGRVVDEQGNGIEGVALEIAGESISTAFTNANGEWTAEVSGVVTVIPSKGGYGFFPKELTVSQETAGEVHFQGVTGKIVGRVVINGEAPDREIQVRIRSSRSPEDEYVTTDELGYFQVLLDEHTDTATIHIRVTSFDNFEWYALETMELVSVYCLDYVPLQPAFLPEIDLYGGLSFIRPEQFERISSYPYEGQIVEYKGDVDILYYELYFCDEDGNFLDYSRMTFTGDSFIFNGLLASGQVIEEDVVWYVQGCFEQDGYRMRVCSFGVPVHFGEETE